MPQASPCLSSLFELPQLAHCGSLPLLLLLSGGNDSCRIATAALRATRPTLHPASTSFLPLPLPVPVLPLPLIITRSPNTSLPPPSSSPPSSNRVVVLSVLVILTLVFCIVKLVLFALTPNPDRMRVGLFCLSTLECIFLTVKWTVATDIQLHFVALFLHVSAYLLLCCYYGRLAMRVRHKEDLARQLIVPIAICVECFFFFTLIYSLLTIVSDSSECRRPHWLLLSTSQVVLAGVFIVAGVFLHKRLSSIGQSAKELILSRKVTLWTLITAFGLSAVVQFANDLILQTSSTADCDRTYGSPGSAGYTAAILIVRIIGQLFPIWMLIFFLSSGHKVGGGGGDESWLVPLFALHKQSGVSLLTLHCISP